MKDKMGLKDLLYKKKAISEADELAVGMQQADNWLMSNAPTYKLCFDAAVPMNLARTKYLAVEEIRQKYNSFKEKSAHFFEENFDCTGDMFDLYELYKWVELCLSTAFQMVIYAPSNSIRHFVNFNEATSYFDNVFLQTEGLCKTIVGNMKQIDFATVELRDLDGSEVKHNEDFILYEDGVKKIKDCGELELCQSLLRMFAECQKYCDYLLDITVCIYERVPYVVDDEGRYIRIGDWERTKGNISRHINIENREHGLTTGDDFIAMIE